MREFCDRVVTENDERHAGSQDGAQEANSAWCTPPIIACGLQMDFKFQMEVRNICPEPLHLQINHFLSLWVMSSPFETSLARLEVIIVISLSLALFLCGGKNEKTVFFIFDGCLLKECTFLFCDVVLFGLDL